MKVFWSWQNDVAPSRCRHFIREALAEAVQAVGRELGLEDAERPELDHDTRNEPGMVDIAATILRKISESAVFVADVTPLTRYTNGKALPNPNVLIELGWALQKPGWERIIAVLNTADGWSVNDLPFDIRHRRIVLYELGEGIDRLTRAQVKTRLVTALTEALRINLAQHLAEVSTTREIKGVASKEGERSIWASATDHLSHHDSFGRDHLTTVALPPGPRGYFRAVPAAWSKGPPSVSDLHSLSEALRIWPPTEGGTAGNFGVSDEGYIFYWITGRDAQGNAQSSNVAYFLDTTGEIWILHGTAIETTGNQRVLRVASLVANWSRCLRRSMLFFDAFDANPVRKVEVGLTGIKGVRWLSSFSTQSPPARKAELVCNRQHRDWSAKAQLEFLTDAYSRVLDLFGFPKANASELRGLLARFDPESINFSPDV